MAILSYYILFFIPFLVEFLKFDPINVYNIGAGVRINPSSMFGLFVARKETLNQVIFDIVAQCLGATYGVGMVKAL